MVTFWPKFQMILTSLGSYTPKPLLWVIFEPKKKSEI